MLHSLQVNELPEGVAAFRIHGPLLFGAAEKLQVIEDQISSMPPVVLLRLRNMTAIDGTGLFALENLADKPSANGKTLVLCGMRDQPERMMKKAEFHQHVGDENICPNFQTAIVRAKKILDSKERIV